MCRESDLKGMSDEAQARLARNGDVRAESHFARAHIRHQLHHVPAGLQPVHPQRDGENHLAASFLLASWHLRKKTDAIGGMSVGKIGRLVIHGIRFRRCGWDGWDGWGGWGDTDCASTAVEGTHA